VVQSGTTLEYQVKAAFIFNFISFTQWPASALGPPSSPLRICVAGDDPFRGALESTVSGERILDHPIAVEHLRGSAAGRCHVLFVAAADAARVPELLRDVGSSPILTIGESDQFLRSGGVVNLVVDEGHVRFDVSQKAAVAHGLTLSSRLLRVARSVR
jgi:hypothetical protein